MFQPVVFGIIKNEGKILLTLRDDKTIDGDISEFHNMWQLPGGGVEFGEQLEEALLRECREEVGLDVVIDHTLGYVQSAVRGMWQGVFISYVCHLKDPQQKVVINEEASAFEWHTFEEARTLLLTPLTLRILEHFNAQNL